jgi:AraC-like DNA-binding protein
MNHSYISISGIVFKEAAKDYYVPPHIRKKYHWFYLHYGAVKIIVNDKEFDLRSGDSILIPPGATRCQKAINSAPGLVSANFKNHGLGIAPIECRLLMVSSSVAKDIACLISEIRHSNQIDSPTLITSLLTSVLIKLVRMTLSSNPTESTAVGQLNATWNELLVKQADNYIRQNFCNKISRSKIADSTNVSPSHLARVYKQLKGQTLGKTISSLRIESAKELLLNSTLSISNIAEEVGFSSFSHFIKTFKAHALTTPSEYRKKSGMIWRKTIDIEEATIVKSDKMSVLKSEKNK